MKASAIFSPIETRDGTRGDSQIRMVPMNKNTYKKISMSKQ